ncbi:MMPL family transporter [Labedella endophytica]|uniref:MMPL family transporter n=1 Tax=Labedella endophytica TaxID=1523160 RepID=A0A433JTB0_9MICO|nr:MMPL family transporter [Labedella endophytica]RUR01561.1 MMPL family transporter [Labedella endophytica]
MSSLLYSLGRWAFRMRKTVIAVWIILLALAGGSALLFNQGTDNGVSIPGTESQEALDRLSTTFPQVSGASAQIVVDVASGSTVNDDDVKDPIEDALASLDDLGQVDTAQSPYDEMIDGSISDDDRAAIISIQFDGAAGDITESTRDDVTEIAATLADDLPSGAESALGGQLYSTSFPAFTITEVIGIIVALVVLILTFGSAIAAGIPLMTALLGVAITIALIYLSTAFGAVSSTTPMLALMLGLAVGIDYALFIISRHQDNLKRGMEPEESAAQSVATAGSAVIFAGLTVIIALVGLSVANIPFLTVMGVAAAVGVGIAVIISLTLIPAVLGIWGMRIVPKRTRRAIAAREAHDPLSHASSDGDTVKPNRFFHGWVKAATRWPIVTILAVVGAVVLLALPAAGLRLALPDAGALPPDDPARIAYDMVSDNFGEGFNGPLIVTGTIVESTDPLGLMDDLKSEIEDLDGVAAVPLATPNPTADTGIIQVIPEGSPDSEETKALVAEIRGLHDYFLDEYDVDLSVTGFTAVGIDVSDKLGEALLPFGILVVGLSLILLTMVFRSIWVPVTAALGYLLSVLASFGVVALVFENGVGADLLHVANTGPVISFMPIILMGVLFGLAMDYEVFLVARMREDYVHSGDARRSITTGFLGSAKVVTAAAVIMFAVFAAFVPEGDTNIKPIALGLATGVFVDAFIVRMTLMPAVLSLLGERAWWIPRWLDKALPHFDVEGEGIHKELALRDFPAPGADVAVAAEGVRVAEDDAVILSDLSLMVPNGGSVVIHGASPLTVSAALLTLTGRLAPSEGKLKVAGLPLPVRASGVRSRTGYVDLGRSDDPVIALRRSLAERPSVIAIDGVDLVTDTTVRAQLRDLLAGATSSSVYGEPVSPLAILLGTTGDTADVLPAPGATHTLTQASAAHAAPTMDPRHAGTQVRA